MLPLEFQVPAIHLLALSPMLVLLGTAMLGLLVEAFAPRSIRNFVQVTITLVAIGCAFGLAVRNWLADEFTAAGAGAFSVDGPTYVLWWLLLACGFLAILLFAERSFDDASAFTPQGVAVPGSEDERAAMRAGLEHTEVFPLALFALSGMMMFAAAADLMMLFVALEVMSLPLYLLTGLARRGRLLSQEAALKYFLLGALSSAIFLMGVALLYGYAGSFGYAVIAQAVPTGNQGYILLLGGIGLTAIGLLFKIGAVPFHNWTPDVYQGAPTPVTAFMAACTKIAAVGALTRFLFVAVGGARWDWQPVLAVIAALTIVVGSILAVVQDDLKRMLAYSSIAHAGFLLAAIVGATSFGSGAFAGQLTSVSSVLFYLATYGLATVAAFALLTLVRRRGGEATNIASWRGLGREHPLLGVAIGFLMLSFAGIPLTAGFIGKLAVFTAAWRGGFAWLVVLAVIMSVVAAFFYLRIIVAMFFSDEEPERDVIVANPNITTWIPIVVGVAGTLVLGIFPGPFMDLAIQASQFLR